MAIRLTIVILLFSSSMLVDSFVNAEEDSLPIQKPCFGKEKVTKLRLYLQDLVGGENKTVWPVAKLNITDNLPSHFGMMLVLDNLVTSGPEHNSGEIGRMQGLVGLVDLKEIALTMLVNVVFTRGKYKGSTISILGRNPLLDEVREVPVVGGTGAFRMARGYVFTRTHSIVPYVYGVYEYNVTIAHLDDDDGLC